MMLIRNLVSAFSKKKMIDSFKHFLQHDAGASVRTEPHQKDRKYLHVQITQQFKQQEQQRKQLRLAHMKQRKKLLQQKISTQSKLLTSTEKEELTDLNKQIQSLSQLIQEQSSALQRIDKSLQETEATHVVIEGSKKLIVLNKIQYLKHMNMHPSGLVLHPQTIKIIENVHYLVNNNLPVNKYKLFQLMPELFQQEIGELEQSMQKLIQQKKLDPQTDPSGRIRFFVRHRSRFEHPEQDIIDLQDERRAIYENMELQIVKIIDPHMDYIRLVQQGKTPFRNTVHMISVLVADNLPLKLTEQEQAVRNSLIEIAELKDKFEQYSDQVDDKIIKMRYRYIQPPEYVKNHPRLLQRYQKVMIKYTNPTDVTQELQDSPVDDGGRAYLEQKLQQLMVTKYHPKIEELWNSGRRDELIANKKKMQIQFYNDSTNIFEEYQQMLADQRQKQQFLKIPKRQKEIEQQTYSHISLDDLTKAVFVNNKNPVKHNLSFFTSFFGLPSEQETRKLFNSFSYLRVLPDQEDKQVVTLKYEIMKFKSP